MLREAKVARKLLIFENNQAYLKNEDSDLRLQVLPEGDDNNIIKVGSKIELTVGDRIIITTLHNGNIFISISNYHGFGIFEEDYFEIIELRRLEELKRDISSIGEREYQIILLNIRAIKRKTA